MRFEQSLIALRPHLENISYCRLSAYFSEKDKTRAQSLDKAARAALVAFAALSLYDLFTQALSFKVKLIVHGTLILFVSSIALSVLLKRILTNSKQEEPSLLSDKDKVNEAQQPQEQEFEVEKKRPLNPRRLEFDNID